MSEADLLRQRAESLLAMALKAREQGQFNSADSLLAEAAQFINDADALEDGSRPAPTGDPRRIDDPARQRR